MIDRQYLHHLWTRIRPIKTSYLFTALLCCVFVHVIALRANNIRMAELRDAVYVADEKGEGVEEALQNLRAFVNSHMNTKLDAGKGIYPPIQLKHTYDRLVKAEQDRVSAANAKIYTDAQNHCERVNPTSVLGRDRVGCIEEYVKSHGAVQPRTIPDALYKFDFVSPRWSPDLAGWSLVAAAVLLFLTALRFVSGKWLQTITR
jgi:hypothetical protein